jgi:hypothetical protein
MMISTQVASTYRLAMQTFACRSVVRGDGPTVAAVGIVLLEIVEAEKRITTSLGVGCAPAKA